MTEVCVRQDLLKHPAAMLLLWGVPIGIILVTSNFAVDAWVVTAGWTVSLLIMGTACLVNSRRCGRMHCFFTGPFFLTIAVVSLMHGTHVLPLGPHGWSYISLVLLSGAVLLCVVPEWIWGRYRRAPRSDAS